MPIKSITRESASHWKKEHDVKQAYSVTPQATELTGWPPRLGYSIVYAVNELDPPNLLVYRIVEEKSYFGTGTPEQLTYYGVPVVGRSYVPAEVPLESIPKDLLERLKHLTSLPESWYVPGSCQIDRRAIQKAVELLSRIFGLAEGTLVHPFIAPSPDGGLALRWKTPQGTELHLEVPPAGAPVEFLFVRTADGQDVEELEGLLDETGVIVGGLLGRLGT